MIDQKTLDAFQMMWGPFPEPVMLIHKDRTVLAANDSARSMGVPTGIKCFSLNPEAASSHCKSCKGNQALRESKTVSSESITNGKSVIAYWMPLKEVPDVYVHFGIGTADAMCQQLRQPVRGSEMVNL